MLEYVWDYGDLQGNEEVAYVRTMASRNLSPKEVQWLTSLIISSHDFMRSLLTYM